MLLVYLLVECKTKVQSSASDKSQAGAQVKQVRAEPI